MSGFSDRRPWLPAAHLVGAKSSLEVSCRSAKGRWTAAIQISSALENSSIAPAMDKHLLQRQDDVRPPRLKQRRFSTEILSSEDFGIMTHLLFWTLFISECGSFSRQAFTVTMVQTSHPVERGGHPYYKPCGWVRFVTREGQLPIQHWLLLRGEGEAMCSAAMTTASAT